MYPAPFEYHTPKSLDEVIALLGRHPDDAKILAGGHSLLPILKLRFAEPAHLIDLRKVPLLNGIREADGALVIGAMTTHRSIENSDLVRRKLQILSDAARQIGDAQVRSRGTIGGSLVHADPNADLPAVMLAAGAVMKAVGPSGARTIKAQDFFLGIMTSAIGAGEVLTEIQIPIPTGRTGGAYAKYPHPASRFAVVGAAAMVTLGSGQVVQSAQVALTGVGPMAFRAAGTEQALIGQAVDATLIKAAAQRAAEGAELVADAQGSEAYKANLARVYVAMALEQAVERARA
jgi:aerobic carbon-monoxide dehydrogenase medium subunit